MNEDLRAAVAADMPRLKTLLAELVRLESVSHGQFDPEAVRGAGEHIRQRLEDGGFSNTRLLEGDGHPAVFGEIPGPDGAPTILLYAHYDVQPPGPTEDWTSPPFELTERDGRMYGRGASDDKAGLVMHLGAIAAHGDHLPVGIQVFFEGEEESGSPNLEAMLARYDDLLHPDVIVIGDGGNWEVGTPAILTSLRGLAACTFELRTLKNPVHSGEFGGVFPDALSSMARLLATLMNDDGTVAVEGIASYESDRMDYPEDRFRIHSGVVDGVNEIGTGSIPSRLWTHPAVTVVALDAPRTSEAINQLVPAAKAKVSLRIPPGQDAAEALRALKKHIVDHAPWGAQIKFVFEELGDASLLDTDNFAVAAWKAAFEESFGTETVEMGAGGSIPFIATFAEMFPDAPILVVGCGDPTSSIHAPDESQHIGDLEKMTLSEAIAFRLLGDRGI